MVKEKNLTDGSSGFCPLGPSAKVKSAVRKAIKKINSGSSPGMNALNTLFESKFRLSSEKILFANSLNELIYLIPEVLKPERVLIAGPALNIYEDAARSAGAEVSCIAGRETDGFVPELSNVLKNAGDKDLVFIANPNRIHGRMIPVKILHETVERLSPGGPHVVIDESLVEFAGSGDFGSDIVNTGKVTILRTTAFFYGMPGLELAHAVSSPEMIQLYKKENHSEINNLSIAAARAAYKDSAYHRAVKQFVLTEKKMLMKMLAKIDWIRVYDTDTNVLLIKINKNSDEVAETLKRAGLALRDCAEIRGLDSSFFRISVMKHEKNLKLISVLRSLL